MAIVRGLFEGKRKLFWALVAGTLALDQASKLLLWHPPGEGRPPVILIPHVLRVISHGGNLRGALGLGPSGPLFYIVAALVGLTAVIVFFAATDVHRGAVHWALGMLAGGAIGNLVDRLALGYVRDFVDLHWGDTYHWHTFNAADAAICIGFVLIVYETFFVKEQPPEDAGQGASRAAT